MTSKVKGKKKVEVSSQIRLNTTRTSNVASTLKTQNIGILATRRRELQGLGHKWRPLQQGEYVGVGVGLALPEVQQHEAL